MVSSFADHEASVAYFSVFGVPVGIRTPDLLDRNRYWRFLNGKPHGADFLRSHEGLGWGCRAVSQVIHIQFSDR